VIAAEEEVDLGEPNLTLEDVVSDWQRPGYDVEAGTICVFDCDRLIAYADHAGEDFAYSAVHPEHRGRGIGTQLARWNQTKARGSGAKRVGAQVS
jgi:GNAT superfamily N-acetyltransferase